MNDIQQLIDFGLKPEFCTPEFLASLGLSPSTPWRFINKVDKFGPIVRPELGRCWKWSACTLHGYGALSKGLHRSRVIAASRVSYFLHFGLPPEDKPFVLHKCDSPPCTNPMHLFTGTQSDNQRDMMKKGRNCGGFIKNPPRGKLNVNTKLNPEMVKQIRSKYIPRIYTQEMLAAEFGVNYRTIGAVLAGECWAWL